MGNKLFVIGGYNSTFEIFDSYSRKFTYIKTANFTTKYRFPYGAVCIGQIIVVFSMKQTKPYYTNIIIYDVRKDKWIEKECSVLKNFTELSCVKYYID